MSDYVTDKIIINNNGEDNKATNLNGVADTKENKNEIDMNGFLERSEKAAGISSSATSGGYNDPLPEGVKEKALYFLDKGVGTILRTVEYNRNTDWTDNESKLFYLIEEKTREIIGLRNSLKSEMDGEKIYKRLTEQPVDWIVVSSVGNGLFTIKKKENGEILFTDNAEMTMKMIDTLSKMNI